MTSQGMKLAAMGFLWWLGLFVSLTIWGLWGLLALPLILVVGIFIGDRV